MSNNNGYTKKFIGGAIESGPGLGLSLITGKPIREPQFYESMTEIRDPSGNGKVRVWRTESELPEYPDVEIIAIFKAIPDGANVKDIANALGSIERVTAVEVVDSRGIGFVSYYEW